MANILVKYPFNDNSDGLNGFAYTDFDSSVLSNASVTQGSGLSMYSVDTDSWSGSIQVLKTGPGTEVSGATAATALDNDWYVEFTLTANSSMDIRSIEADWSRGGTYGTRGWFVRSSLDGYTSDLYSNQTPHGTAAELQHASFNISGFTGTSMVTFRFYIYTDRTSRYMDFQNVQFNSTADISPVTANFTATPVEGTVPLTVSFTDQSLNDPTSWLWDFGDLTTSTNQNPVHTYQKNKKYTVTLTASDAAGEDTKVVENFINVKAVYPGPKDQRPGADRINPPSFENLRAGNNSRSDAGGSIINNVNKGRGGIVSGEKKDTNI